MIINHEDALRGTFQRKVYKNLGSKRLQSNERQFDANYTISTKKKTQNCVSASLQLHLYPLRPNSLKLFIISYPSHQHLDAHSDCSPHSWPRWWHCLSFRPPFAYNHSCFIITLFDKAFAFFLRSAWSSSRGDVNCTGFARAMYQTWWEHTRKLKHGNNSNSLTSVKMTLSSAKTTSH